MSRILVAAKHLFAGHVVSSRSIWPRCLKFAARHAPFLSCKWKNSWHECPKTYGGRDYLSTWSRHPYVFGHSCHEFFHLHDKNRGCRAANFMHRGQIQTGTVLKKLSCKPGKNSVTETSLPELRNLLIFSAKTEMAI